MSGAADARDDSADPADEISGVCVADHSGVYAGEAEAGTLARRTDQFSGRVTRSQLFAINAHLTLIPTQLKIYIASLTYFPFL